MSDPLMMSACCPLDSEEVVPVIRCAGRWLCEVAPQTTVAERVGDFIRRRFFMAYGAEPALRIPDLLALTTAQGSLLAAVGVRNASRAPLFLEDYLEEAVDTFAPLSGTSRQHIAEIAHLAGVEAGVSRYLFATLAVWLDNATYQWVVCTGTDQLRNSFSRLGIATHILSAADPSRLADGGAGWGRYYDHHPVVMALNVAESLVALRAIGLLKVTHPVTGAVAEDRSAIGGRYGYIA